MSSHPQNPLRPSLRLEDFRRLFEASPTAVAVSRLADGVFVEANEAFLAMHGYRRDEVIGHTSVGLGLWRRLEERQAVLSRLAGPEDSHRFRFEYRRKSGETGRALATVTLIEMDGTLHLVGFLTDLAELDDAKGRVEARDASLAFIENAARAGLWDWDAATGLIRWSPGMEALYGLPPGGFGGRFEDYLAQVHPDDRPAMLAVSRRLSPAAPLVDDEFRIVLPDGRVRWIASHGTAVFDAGGRLVRSFGFNMDITVRKEAQLALVDRERKLSAIVASRQIVAFAQDARRRYTWIGNPSLVDRPEDVLGRTDEEAFGPAVAAPLVALKERVLATGVAERQEVLLPVPGGRRWMDVSVTPEKDARGRVVGLVGAAADITARKEAELALRDREQRLAAATRVSQLIFFAQDPDLRFEWLANPSLGLAEAEVLGRTDEEAFGPAIAAPFVALKRQALTTGESVRRELRVNWRGRTGWFDLIVEPRRDGQGRINGIVCAAADITARKEAEEDAAEAHRQLARLAAHRQDALEAERAALARDVHDQVGAALTGLRLRLEGLAGRLPAGDAALRRELRGLAADAEAAQVASREICARLRPPILEDLGLAETCRWYLRDWAGTTGIRAAGRFPPLAAEPPADLAIDIYRVLQELLTNAARHAGASRVSASLAGGKAALRLRVADDGHGFPPGRTRRGYGLAGIRERAARHGGTVKIDSGPEGTTVTVTFRENPGP